MDKHIGRVVLPLGRQREGGVIEPLGTCFAISESKLVTAAHATGPNGNGLMAIIGRADSMADYQDTTNSQVSGTSLKISAYDPIHDICILELVNPGSFGFSYSLGGADELTPGDSVVAFGYPHADHGRLVLTQQSSAVGAKILLGSAAVKTKSIVLNTQTRPGQSGGPVFLAGSNRVCAMIVGGYSPDGAGKISMGGIDPQTLHQTTHAVSAEYIKKML